MSRLFNDRKIVFLIGLAVLMLVMQSASIRSFDPAWADTGPSILNPNTVKAQEYRFPVSAIDPTPATNPAGASAQGVRGENQLVIYTPASGTSTRTNDSGFEAVVTGGTVQAVGGADNAIPADGFVISAHGTAAKWAQKFVKPGARITLSTEAGQLIVRHTPEVYLYEIDAALKLLDGREPVPAQKEKFNRYAQQAQTCRRSLAESPEAAITPELIETANACRHTAHLAFYQTIESRPEEFRGAWVRPTGRNPEAVAKVIESLKKHGIQHVFLETYYQGKTIYPSEVMRAYELPEQHPMFKGTDPLQVWIDAAHQAGLKVHVWVQVFFAGNAQENAELYGPILQKYPQWRNIQRPHVGNPNPVPSNLEPGHYFLDPANPEVRDFLEKLLLEMVTRYPVDGLNLDYIRYPASAAANKSIYLNTTWGYTAAARAQFQAMIEKELQETEAKKLEALKKAGKPVPPATAKPKPVQTDPKDFTVSHPLWPRWVSWRKDNVSSFVQNISAKARLARPGIMMTAVVFPSTDPAYVQKLQDYPRWTQEGWVDALTPIGLSTNLRLLIQQSLHLKETTGGTVPVYIGMFGMYNRATPVELVSQIEAVHQAGMPGVVLFDWSRLTPEYDEALMEGPFRP